MKILLVLLFFSINLISYSDYLLTNSEIVTFYDTTRNEIRYIKGNLFKPIDISQIDILFKDSNNLYNLKNYVEKIEKIENTDILKITYKIKNTKIELTLIPSVIDNSSLYVNLDLVGENLKKTELFIKLKTQEDKKLIEFKNDGVLTYDKFNIETSLDKNDYKISFYNEENGEKKLLNTSQIKLRKYDIFYEIYNLSRNRSFFLKIIFDNKLEKKGDVHNLVIEEEKWKEKIVKIEDEFLKKILKNLYLLTNNILIPNKITFEKSEELYSTKAKLIYSQNLLNFPIDSDKILNEIVFRKSTEESIELYKILFELVDEKSYGINSKLFRYIIRPQVLSIVDLLNEEGELLSEEDNIEIYYKLTKLIDLLKNRHGFEKDQEYIEEASQKLKVYINKYYLKNNIIKTRRYTDEYDVKNIKYIDLFEIKNKTESLKKFFNKYYIEKYSLLLTERNYIDINFNLVMISLFYKYGLIEEADKLFKGIQKILEKNQGYIIPRYNIYSKNRIGIFGDSLYLYIRAYKNREKILEKK